MMNTRGILKALLLSLIVVLSSRGVTITAAETDRPNIVLVMADDMGWGQTGYYNHPVLKTPNLDAMAKAGLRFDRFYAGAPVCSPTRASVLTGRSNMRTGVNSHGYALRLQEQPMPKALKDVGYATGHFGKWHLNGIRGPGVPILKDDTHSPGAFGFDYWLSVTNFFDRDPVMSRNGTFEEFEGDSSEVIVDEALKFIKEQVAAEKPFFTVIWYGTPHSPFKASEADNRPFAELDTHSKNHYGELVAMDRSIGTLRQGLRDLKVAENTLFWFCSDNGGLPRITPETVGGLRGNKGTVYEGGLRVPSIIEWPAGIKQPRVTEFPSCTMDIFPTIAEILGLPDSVMLKPQDGMSLKTLLNKELGQRKKPIPFCCRGNTALLDNNIKLIHLGRGERYELYDLATDPKEANNLYESDPKLAGKMQKQMTTWTESMNASIAGRDYPEGHVDPAEPESRFWMQMDEYRPYFDQWKTRWEYEGRLRQNRRPPMRPHR